MLSLILFIIFIIFYREYKKTSYYKVTKNSFFSKLFDKGIRGEYLSWKNLRILENNNCKFLFNLYLPKENNETTEIDMLMIAPEGVFVFESKNYSGWIFGNSKYEKWVQTLPQYNGRCYKEYFFNPVFQNKLHIKYLKKHIPKDIPVYSVIVFSDNCRLMKVTCNEKDTFIINRFELYKTVVNKLKESDVIFDINKIDEIYNNLYSYSQVTNYQKQQHINNINKE